MARRACAFVLSSIREGFGERAGSFTDSFRALCGEVLDGCNALTIIQIISYINKLDKDTLNMYYRRRADGWLETGEPLWRWPEDGGSRGKFE